MLQLYRRRNKTCSTILHRQIHMFPWVRWAAAADQGLARLGAWPEPLVAPGQIAIVAAFAVAADVKKSSHPACMERMVA